MKREQLTKVEKLVLWRLAEKAAEAAVTDNRGPEDAADSPRLGWLYLEAEEKQLVQTEEEKNFFYNAFYENVCILCGHDEHGREL